MSNLHKDLNDSQLHVPKGFAGASNSTACTKDSSGNLVWSATSGIGSNNFVFATQGLRQAKTSAEYTHYYSNKLNNNWGLDNAILPTTLDAVDSLNFGRLIIPINCTLSKIVAKGNCTSATAECYLKIYHLRYDCAVQPTTITNTTVYQPFDRVNMIVDKLNCVEVTSGFGITAMQAGDIIVVGSRIALVANQPFTYQLSIQFTI